MKQVETPAAGSGDGPRLAWAVLPTALAVLVLLTASGSSRLAPSGALGNPWEIVAWILVAALAAVHRPLSGRTPGGWGVPAFGLGLGAFALPAVAARLGVVPAAVVAAGALVVSEMARSAAGRRLGVGGAAGRMLPTLERGLLLALVTLLVGGLDALWLRRMVVGEIPRLIPVVLLYAGALALATLLLTRQRRLTLGPAGLAAPVLLDAAGWLLGGLSTQLALAAGWSRAVFLWPALSLLALEAARNALLRVRSDHRVGHFERLQEAHERILTETSGMGGIAQQVLVECRNILPVSWFQFELAEGDAWRSWAAGPDGFLTEGRPQPPARPGMLPGIHKRADWRLLEQPLQRAAAGGTGVGEVESDPIAVVRLWCDPRRIEEGAEELFATLVPQMASSVDRALLDQEARLDPLTGVPVRRVLEARLQIAYRRACDEGRPMSVIMCDIDFFKKVNDTHGHAAGDEALKLVAATLDSTRREDDLCCRYGGEEFTLLLERTDGDAALALAERLRQAVEALRLVYEGRDIPLALSLGVAAFPELYIKTGSELLLLADEALYEAKSRGRNQCLLHCGHGSFRPVVGAPGPERPRTEEAEGAG